MASHTGRHTVWCVFGCVFNDIYGLSEWRDRIRKQCPSFEEFGDSCRKAEAVPVGVRDLWVTFIQCFDTAGQVTGRAFCVTSSQRFCLKTGGGTKRAEAPGMWPLNGRVVNLIRCILLAGVFNSLHNVGNAVILRVRVCVCVHSFSSRQPLAVIAIFSGTGHCNDWLLYGASYKEYLQWSGLY